MTRIPIILIGGGMIKSRHKRYSLKRKTAPEGPRNAKQRQKAPETQNSAKRPPKRKTAPKGAELHYRWWSVLGSN